jgi:hypothetical protein
LLYYYFSLPYIVVWLTKANLQHLLLLPPMVASQTFELPNPVASSYNIPNWLPDCESAA